VEVGARLEIRSWAERISYTYIQLPIPVIVFKTELSHSPKINLQKKNKSGSTSGPHHKFLMVGSYALLLA
jgi:hypothetical protein